MFINRTKKWQFSILAALLLALAGSWHTAHAQPSYNRDVCVPGYIERQAFPGDDVCVTPETRAQVIYDNMHASDHIDEEAPGGALYGGDTCLSPYVWRLADPNDNDHVCVTQETKDQTKYDNSQWRIHAARIYDYPTWWSDGYRLDWCLNSGTQCGQPAADNFCKFRKWTGAADFAQDPNIGASHPTIASASYKVCDQSYCDGFQYITCYGKIDGDRIRANPSWQGHRLDVCYEGDTGCGKKAADAFCRNDPEMKRNGYSTTSFYHLVDPVPSNVDTITIGDGRVYDKDKYPLYDFDMIICQ